MTTYFSARELLAPPTERAAFSDRQAYVCAELSKVAYFRFEGGHTLDQALEAARTVLGDDARLKVLEEQLKLVLAGTPSSAADGHAALKMLLHEAEFELVRTFCTDGTQALLCTRQVNLESGGTKTVAYLAFRGTEPTDFKDIKTDIRAALRTIEVGDEKLEMHSGYLDAFGLVRADIESALKATPHDQLILTGHSLGGALAIVTTRLLAADSKGACYTFGAPPVGAVEVQNRLKTPVYQIVNEIDIVPRLPNPWSIAAIKWLLRAIRLLLKSITVLNAVLAKGSWDERLESFVESMTRYRHPGYVSYLVGSGNEARLRFNVSSYDEFKWWMHMMWKQQFSGFAKMVSDHSIDAYIAKLRTHARGRQ